MKVLVAVALLASAALFPQSNSSRTYGTRSVARSKGTLPKSRSVGDHVRHSESRKCESCERDSNGRIKRDPAAVRGFRAGNPCPSTGKSTGACPGYVVDHIVPLKRGGEDKPENMQWQTTKAAKAKDKIE